MSPRPSRVWSSSRCLHANELGVNLKNGWGSDLTSREAGDLGKAPMVKKMCPVGRAKYERQSRTAVGHCQRVKYIASVTI